MFPARAYLPWKKRGITILSLPSQNKSLSVFVASPKCTQPPTLDFERTFAEKEMMMDEDWGEDEMGPIERCTDQDQTWWKSDTDTTKLHDLIKSGDLDQLRTWLEEDPVYAVLRSKDGRGRKFLSCVNCILGVYVLTLFF